MRRQPPADSSLNLAPILNLVMILIPLLLISIEFEQLGVINVAVPGFVDPTPKPGEPPLNLTVAITHTGFLIGAQGQTLDPVARRDPAGPPAVPGYDFAALYERMAAIKQAHPDTSNLSVSADPDIPYELVVETMDTVRYMRDGAGKPGRQALFPDVTLAVIQ